MEPRPIAITLLGATGAVGRAVLEVLEDLDVPVGRVRLLATARSAGQEIDFRGGPDQGRGAQRRGLHRL